MLGKNFEDTLIVINDILKENGIHWVLIGSSNLQLHGIIISPRDLDIAVKFDDLFTIRELFLKYGLSPLRYMDEIKGRDVWEIKFTLNDVEVQVCGESEDGLYFSKLIDKNIDFISVKKVKIPCLSLEVESQNYEKSSRFDRVNLIKGFKKNNS